MRFYCRKADIILYGIHDTSITRATIELLVFNATMLLIYHVYHSHNIKPTLKKILCCIINRERVVIDDEAYDLNMKLIEGFEDLDDVDACYHNIA